VVDEEPVARLTPESTKALADNVIEASYIPKKVPAVDDIDGQIQALTGALASALLTATEMPLSQLQPVNAALAAQLVAYGVRQTEHADPAAQYAPTWIIDGARQESVQVPDQPQHTEAEPVIAATAVAPPPPDVIALQARAVRR
jgi:hypothetical protein